MKLFMIWYLSGHVVLAAGPLPYDMTECMTRAKEDMTVIAEKDTHKEMEGLLIECQLRLKMPELGDKQ